jgi:hypothetical protein
MALYFAPAANLVMSSVLPHEQGIASGANNALREVGGALGIAIMSSIFSAQGGYENAQSFVDGLRPAVVAGALLVVLGAFAALVIPARQGLTARESAEPDASPEEAEAGVTEASAGRPAPLEPTATR